MQKHFFFQHFQFAVLFSHHSFPVWKEALHVCFGPGGVLALNRVSCYAWERARLSSWVHPNWPPSLLPPLFCPFSPPFLLHFPFSSQTPVKVHLFLVYVVEGITMFFYKCGQPVYMYPLGLKKICSYHQTEKRNISAATRKSTWKSNESWKLTRRPGDWLRPSTRKPLCHYVFLSAMPSLLVSLVKTVVCVGLTVQYSQTSVFECTVAHWDQFWLLRHLFAHWVAFTAALSEFMDPWC